MLRTALVIPIMACSGRPAAASPPQPFCKDESPVERVENVLVCHDQGDHGRYSDAITRISGHWYLYSPDGSLRSRFSDDEMAHTDAALAEGIKKICAGERDRSAPFPSSHTESLGWPMPRCRTNEKHLVLHKHDSQLELPAPQVEEMAFVYWIVEVHSLGNALIWDR